MDALTCEGLSFTYAGSSVEVLHNVRFCVPEGSFTLLVGENGSGKTTLLRSTKPELAPVGASIGRVLIFGKSAQDYEPVESAARIGYVMQDILNQNVMDTVWHELAFGLENLGIAYDEMHRRIAETAHFFGIGSWYTQRIAQLSGGQRQILNLAAIVAMQPSILVLDEPTAQLDPIASEGFLHMLSRVNRELGITVLIAQHRLEDVLPYADSVLYLQNGTLVSQTAPRVFAHALNQSHNPLAEALPASTRIAWIVARDDSRSLPLDVREGKQFLDAHHDLLPVFEAHDVLPDATHDLRQTNATLLEASEVCFRYERREPFVLENASLALRQGEIHALVGGNASGKSTLLTLLAGALKPTMGHIKREPRTRVALLPQNTKALFERDTIGGDLHEWQERFGYDERAIEMMADRFGLLELMGRHPYDLSGGEMQRAALAKVLLTSPTVILLDEPSKGLDVLAKRVLATYLRTLHEEGIGLLFSSHDLPFVAEIADRVSLLFAGGIACTDETREFFRNNLFYTTATQRVTRGYLENCITIDDVALQMRSS